jgi:DNA invertase Pin-like site-specific DNA recombinase
MTRLKTQAQLDQERLDQVQKLTGQYPIPTNRRALLYSRYSSAKQVVASISKGLQQSDGLIHRALDIGWKRENTTLFIENSMTKDGRIRSVSGTIPIEDRAGISTVIEHVKLGAGAILCDDISRLTRDADLVDAATLARTCKQHDCMIVTNERIYNFKRQADYDAYIAEAQAAAAYLELHIKGKMLRNRQRKAEKGRVANGTAPIGLMLEENTDALSQAKHGYNLKPSPHASGVAWLYKRFAELEASRNGVLRELTAMARRGEPLFPVHPDIDPKTIYLSKVFDSDGKLLGWTVGGRAGLTDILTNPAYIGHIVFNGQIVKRNAHEPIVERDLWQYAFDHLSPTDLENRPIERAPKTVRYSYPESQHTALLAGTRDDGTPVIDGVNGLHVYVQLPDNSYVLRGSRGSTYTDGYETSIRVRELDEIIETELMGMLKTSEYVQANLYRIDNLNMLPDWHDKMEDFDKAKNKQEQTTTPDDTLRTLEGEIALIQQDLKYASGVMDVETRTGLYERLARLSQRRDKLQQAQEDKARTQRKLDQARKDVKTAKERWNSWDLERKRSFIHLVTDSITLEEIASGWLRISVQWSDVLGGLLYDFYLWRDSGTLWTDEEKALLKKHYPKAKRVKLLELLPTRSWKAISMKANLLKLRRIAKSDPSPIPDNMSLSDVRVLEGLRQELTEDELSDTDGRLYVHVTQPSEYVSDRPCDSMAEDPRYGQFSARLYSPTSRD